MSYLGMLSTCSLTILILGCTVSQQVYKAPSKDCSDAQISRGEVGCQKVDGIPYYLPRTAIKIQLPVTKTTESEPALISEARKIFAKSDNCSWNKENTDGLGQCEENKFKDSFIDSDACYKNIEEEAKTLGIEIAPRLVPEFTKTTYKLGDAGLITEAEPDPDQLYFIELKGGMFEKRNLEVSYNPGGVLTQYNSSAEDKSAEFLIKTLSSVTSVVTALGSPNYTEPHLSKDLKCTSNDSKYFNLYDRAMQSLKLLRGFPNSRMSLFKTDTFAGDSKEVFELKLKEFDSTRDAALLMFIASKKVETKTYSISLLPTCASNDNGCSPSVAKPELAKFSKTCGLLSDVPQGSLIYQSDIPKSKPKQECKGEAPITFALTTPPHLKTLSSDPTRFEKILNVTDKRGMYYRIPSTARATLFVKDEPVLVKDLAIAQLGSIASLPAETGSTNVSYKVTLDPVTGMLLKVGITSESASTSLGKDVIDPVANYLEAKKESKDEVTKLERQEAILKLKKSIKELKEAIGE